MDEEEEVAVVAIIVSAVILSKKIRKKRKRRSAWVNPGCKGAVLTGFTPSYWTNSGWRREKYMRITSEWMQKILITYYHSFVQKSRNQTRIWENQYQPKLNFAITIRFLATGNSHQDLSCTYRVHKTTIGKFIPEVCTALYNALKEDYFKVYFVSYFLATIYRYLVTLII